MKLILQGETGEQWKAITLLLPYMGCVQMSFAPDKEKLRPLNSTHMIHALMIYDVKM